MPWSEVMAKYKAHKLRSGSGQKVTNPKQAKAIMLSEKAKAEEGKQEYQAPMSKLRPKRRKPMPMMKGEM